MTETINSLTERSTLIFCCSTFSVSFLFLLILENDVSLAHVKHMMSWTDWASQERLVILALKKKNLHGCLCL